MKAKQYLVLGLGRFGTSVARSLCEQGQEVLAVDADQALVDAVAPYDYRGSLVGDKANSVAFDNEKLHRAVPGFAATVRFDQGVRIALAYILKHPEECQKEDPEFDAWCDRVISALEASKGTV